MNQKHFLAVGTKIVALGFGIGLILLSGQAWATNGTQKSTQGSERLAGGPPGATKPANIVQIAARNGSFKTLTQALKAAGLDQTLSGSGPFTVFAPTDAAFAALEKQQPGTVEMLLKPENKAKLVKLLTYHVVPGQLNSNQLKAGAVNTVEGSPVTVVINGGKVMVNQATVVAADVTASNGVIHAIDKVIMPPKL